MSVEVIKCPACDGMIDCDGSLEFIKCAHCGNTLHLKFSSAPKEPSVMKFTDKALNIPLASCGLGDDYTASGSLMPDSASYTYPMPVRCAAANKFGTAFSFFTGEAYTDDTKCPMLSGPYATVVNQISKIHFRPFMDAATYGDNYIKAMIGGGKMTNACFVESRPFPAAGFNRKDALDGWIKYQELEAQKAGTAGTITGKAYYLEESCKVYEADVGPVRFRIAAAFILRGFRYQLPDMFAMGNIFGGLFGQRKPQNANGAPQGSFGDIPNNGAIEWSSSGIFTMFCPKDRFDEDYKDFEKFVSTFKIDPYILQESLNMQNKMSMEVARYTQQNIAQQNANFQAMQQANRSLQEAYDSANQAWWNRSNAHHAQVMSSSRSAFGETSQDRISRMQSEAIRGVNTYVREDGSTVEVSVDYDHVYSNNLGDTLATNSSFEPGGNWNSTTKI